MITIDYKDRKPIYEQLVDNINMLVARGIYASNFQLPSVRQLAVEIGINPNTIQKAYAELERQGTIYSVSGKGSFVSEDREQLMQKYRAQKGNEIFKIVSEAAKIDISKNQVIEIVDRAYIEFAQGGTAK